MYTGKLTIKQFIDASSIKHSFKYDYSLVNFTSSRDKIEIICPMHGSFEQRVSHHKSGRGCPTCSNRNTKTEFICRALAVHHGKYSYRKSNYITNRIAVEIVCRVHGSFFQVPINHLKGHGCIHCNNIGRYSELNFNNKPHLKSLPAVLYVVKFENDNETFYKIGVSKHTMIKRFEKIKLYNVTIIHQSFGTLYDLFKIEQNILKSIVYKKRYTPKIKIGGDKECFNESQLSSVISAISSEIPKSL